MPLTFRMKSVLGSSRGRGRQLEQAQADFLGQAVALAAVHVLAGQDAILPRRLAAARAGQDVVDVAFSRPQRLAGVLAAAAVARPDRPGAELRPALGHLGKTAQHDDVRNAHRTARRANGVIVLTHGQLDPLRPANGHHVLAIDIERCGHVGGHLHERLLRRAHIDRLPVAVKHQYNRSVEYVVHSSSVSVDS